MKPPSNKLSVMAKKTTNKLQNPFVYQGYKGPEYFCDRTEETEKLISSLRNGRNVTLVAPRKMGKTGRAAFEYGSDRACASGKFPSWPGLRGVYGCRDTDSECSGPADRLPALGQPG